MQKSLNVHYKGLWLNAGWFHGDPFKLISITIGEALEDFRGGEIDQVTFLNIQFLYFVFAFGWSAN